MIGSDLTEFHQIEVDSLKTRLRESEREITRLTRISGAEQRLIELLAGTVQAKRVRYKPAKFGRRGGPKFDKHEQVLLWSDVHAGEIVKPDEVSGTNEYNWSIMLKRHDEISAGLASYRGHRSYSIRALTIAAAGDNASGDIHDELIATNEMPLNEVVVQFGLDAADWIESLIEYYPHIYIPIVFGNHGRKTRKRQAKRKYNNADFVIGNIIAQRLRNYDSVTVDVGHPPRKLFRVFDRQCCLFHGDEVGPSTMVSIPYGGIFRHVEKLSKTFARLGTPVDHFLCGHFHESQTFAGRSICINGSVVGPSEYGLEQFGTAAPPSQTLLTFNERHGLSDVSYIDLQAGVPL